MADAQRASTPTPPPSHRRLASIVVHPPRMSVEPDADGFRPVQRRRRWRRVAEPRRLVPSNLIGKCFNCLAGDHVCAECMFPSKCFNCKGKVTTSASARSHPAIGRWEGKRGRSPGRSPRRQRGTRRCRSSPDHRSAAKTAFARLVSTGRQPSVPPVCEPPTPESAAMVSARMEPMAGEPAEEEQAVFGPPVDAPASGRGEGACVNAGVGLHINTGAVAVGHGAFTFLPL